MMDLWAYKNEVKIDFSRHFSLATKRRTIH